jgi:hypothetical protein
MTAFKGTGIIGGTASGPVVTRMPMNFTASFTQATNQVLGWRSRIRDRHHELFRKNVSGTILVYPGGELVRWLVGVDCHHVGDNQCQNRDGRRFWTVGR